MTLQFENRNRNNFMAARWAFSALVCATIHCCSLSGSWCIFWSRSRLRALCNFFQCFGSWWLCSLEVVPSLVLWPLRGHIRLLFALRFVYVAHREPRVLADAVLGCDPRIFSVFAILVTLQFKHWSLKDFMAASQTFSAVVCATIRWCSSHASLQVGPFVLCLVAID